MRAVRSASLQAVDSLAAAHVGTQLPRVAALDAAAAVLEERCAAAKQQMTADVVSMLQRISLQQVRRSVVFRAWRP